MSFVKYEGLGTSSEVLQKMRDYIKQEGYTIVDDIKDDLDIFDRNITDGKKLVFALRKAEAIIFYVALCGSVSRDSLKIE